MKLVGYPTEWNEEEGLLPIDVQDVQFIASVEELNLLSDFFKECAELQARGNLEPQSIELGDSKPSPKTGISIIVMAND